MSVIHIYIHATEDNTHSRKTVLNSALSMVVLDYNWYSFWGGCSWCCWAKETKVLSVWKYSQSHKPNRDNRAARKDQCNRIHLQVMMLLELMN